MRAVTQERFGGPETLQLTERPVPVLRPRDVLVRVRAAGVDAGSVHLMTGRPLVMRLFGVGLRRPRIAEHGLAFAGLVEALGERAHETTELRPGDRVVGSSMGAFAEFVRAPAARLVALPDDVDFTTAATLPVSAVTALQAVRAARLRPGDRVAVTGAAGGVGTMAVQLAVAEGAVVTGVCSAGKAGLVRSIGASATIDYASDDFTARPGAWDAVIDIAGNRVLGELRRSLAPEGRLVIVGGENGGAFLGGLERNLAAAAQNVGTRQRLHGLVSVERAADLAELVEATASGRLRPVVDTVHPFTKEAVRLAHRTVADGRARGKVVLAVDDPGA